jgi:hypothetical protein
MVASAHALLEIFASATPALYRAFVSVASVFGTTEESGTMTKLYSLLGATNFSDRVLALVPDRLAVLKVAGSAGAISGNQSVFSRLSAGPIYDRRGYKTIEAFDSMKATFLAAV